VEAPFGPIPPCEVDGLDPWSVFNRKGDGHELLGPESKGLA
jgi:hypothetical protein